MSAHEYTAVCVVCGNNYLVVGEDGETPEIACPHCHSTRVLLTERRGRVSRSGLEDSET